MTEEERRLENSHRMAEVLEKLQEKIRTELNGRLSWATQAWYTDRAGNPSKHIHRETVQFNIIGGRTLLLFVIHERGSLPITLGGGGGCRPIAWELYSPVVNSMKVVDTFEALDSIRIMHELSKGSRR